MGRSSQYPSGATIHGTTRGFSNYAFTVSDQPQVLGDKFFNQIELGGKGSYLFDAGFDLGVMFYRHRNRTPVYELSQTSPTSIFTFAPVEKLVDSMGFSVSYTYGNFVFRDDFAFHLNQPLQYSLTSAVETDGHQVQNIFGVDYSAESWNVGFQYQTELSSFSSLTRKFVWTGFQATKRLFIDQIELGAFLFTGLNNDDRWFQPKITWNFNESFSFSGRGDFLSSQNDPARGSLWAFVNENRIFSGSPGSSVKSLNLS